MLRLLRVRQRGYSLALAAGWLTAAVSAAQPSQNLSEPIQLDSKSALKLLLSEAKPDYPLLAKLNYIQGKVRIQVLVTQEGHVREAHVLQGHPFLAASALETVRGWRYRPLVRGADPVPFVAVVEMRFALRYKKLRQFPDRPEEDLRRAVQPPTPLEEPTVPAMASVVRMRLLVNEQGRVIDSKPLRGRSACFEAARENVKGWVFRPARWGSMAVPWYLEVDVPVEESSTQDTGEYPCTGGS